MKTMSAIEVLARKDLRTYFRDRSGMALGFLLPIALVAVFGFIAKFAFGQSGGIPRITLWVVDADRSEESTRFFQALRMIDVLQIRPRAGEPPISAQRARRLVADGEAHHALVIEAGFAQSVRSLAFPKLRVVRDPDRSVEDQVIRVGMLKALVAFISISRNDFAVNIPEVLKRRGVPEEHAKSFASAAESLQRAYGIPKREPNAAMPRGDQRSPIPANQSRTAATAAQVRDPAALLNSLLKLIPIENDDLVREDRQRRFPFHYAQTVCGVTVMMVMFSLVACSTTLLAERQSGALQRLLVAAIPRTSIFWGKFCFTLSIGLVQLLVFFTFGTLAFKIEAFRDPVTLLVLSITWTAAATSFGMLVAAWARTTKQAENLSTILILAMAGLGGCWFPTQLMELPWAAEMLTHSMITYWAMLGFQRMFWDQFSWTHPTMLTTIGIQWAFAIVVSLLAIGVFRRRYLAG